MIFKVSALIWVSLITVLSLSPSSLSSGVSTFSVEHFAAYMVLTLLLVKSSVDPKKAVLLSLIYGIVLEVAQIPIPGRFFDIKDLVMNTAGCGVAFFALREPKSSIFDYFKNPR